MRDIAHAWLLVARTYLDGLRRLAQAASTGEREGEASLAGAARGGIRPDTKRPAA